MSSSATSPPTTVPDLKEAAMKADGRSRAGSQSTSGDYAPSIFSEAESSTTANTSPSQHSAEDDDFVEIDKETFEANTDSDLEEISKETFEANVGGGSPDKVKNGGLKVIYGSTLGGKDPLHAMVQATGYEPRWWIEERQRQRTDRIDKKRKRARTPTKRSRKVYKPEYFDKLPYSPQDYFTSGLDIECEPETSQQFWAKVSDAFLLNSRYETVHERREGFEHDYFESAPGTPSPSRFNDELSVVA
ncbi:hypothetical protein PRZ48_012570 [Zasmidium cellare]|uniref:Uncharacterized protein n=1 Tax=Zasmidium cellare TaxID=395010 RepID=A0ABR0E5E3_ZASCE|nr:hypothetical protein PRZ48_012570 [Zasmidium cellare]